MLIYVAGIGLFVVAALCGSRFLHGKMDSGWGYWLPVNTAYLAAIVLALSGQWYAVAGVTLFGLANGAAVQTMRRASQHWRQKHKDLEIQA